MDLARQLLETEMEVVKEGMTHGELSLEAYTQVGDSSLTCLLTPDTCILTPASQHLHPNPCIRTPASQHLHPKTCIRTPASKHLPLDICLLTSAS